MEKKLLQLDWSWVREKVRAVNPVLAELINALDPGKKYRLTLASYKYGEMIKNKNTRTRMSPALLLKNNIELYFEHNNISLPYALYSPGKLFGFQKSEAHDSPLLSISAGARTVFMLPTIGDMTNHKKLQKAYQLRLPAPHNLHEHWQVFSEIAAYPKADCTWETELLYFPDIWLEKMKKDKSWSRLANFINEQSWQNQSQQNNQLFYEFLLARAQSKKNLKPNAYLADTVKHILNIASGQIPGFAPATDESSAPIKTLQRAFVEEYGIKYRPTIMQPTYFTEKPIYYSLQYPTALASSPNMRISSSTLMEMRELKHIITTLFNELRKEKSVLELAAIANKVQFDFFHNKTDSHNEIKMTTEMPRNDLEFKQVLFGQGAAAPFAECAPFLRGCVKIY